MTQTRSTIPKVDDEDAEQSSIYASAITVPLSPIEEEPEQEKSDTESDTASDTVPFTINLEPPSPSSHSSSSTQKEDSDTEPSFVAESVADFAVSIDEMISDVITAAITADEAKKFGIELANSLHNIVTELEEHEAITCKRYKNLAKKILTDAIQLVATQVVKAVETITDDTNRSTTAKLVAFYSFFHKSMHESIYKYLHVEPIFYSKDTDGEALKYTLTQMQNPTDKYDLDAIISIIVQSAKVSEQAALKFSLFLADLVNAQMDGLKYLKRDLIISDIVPVLAKKTVRTSILATDPKIFNNLLVFFKSYGEHLEYTPRPKSPLLR